MNCPKCKEENKKSITYNIGSVSTLAGYPSYVGSDGVYHHHDNNKVTSKYECSNSHNFTVIKVGTPCPSYPKNCDFYGDKEQIKTN